MGLFSALLLSSSVLAAPPVTTTNLSFHSAFWPNLHHTLYAAAWASLNRPKDALSGTLPEPLTGTLTTTEKAAWDTAVGHYARDLATRDLLFDPQMSSIRRAVSSSSDQLLVATDTPEEIVKTLNAAAPVYRKHWWPMHDRANGAWIVETAAKVAELTPDVTPRLATLYGTPWFAEPVRVDVVRVANWEGGYTGTLGEVHITVASGDKANAGWSGVELIFHEASHALVKPLQLALDAQLHKVQRRERQLWHVVLFAVTGAVVQQALAKRKIAYTPYHDAHGVMDRAWPQYRKPIEKVVPAFVDGKLSREALAAQLVESLEPAPAPR